jgi:hypothetical protein
VDALGSGNANVGEVVDRPDHLGLEVGTHLGPSEIKRYITLLCKKTFM